MKGWSQRSFRYDLNQIPNDCTVEVRNRFKGLDLIERVPDELWTEVHDIVQETGIKTIPKKKKYKKTQWLYEEALQVAVKRREAKSKGEKKRYTHLNTEFQRIARRDKKSENFQMFKLDLEKAEESEIKLPTSAGSRKKQESSRKTPTAASVTTLKPLTV